MKKLLSLTALAVCLAVPAFAQTPEPAQVPVQVPEPILAQSLPPCSQACCYGEFNAATECSYYSPSYGYRPYSQCYWWWTEGGMCEG